MTDELYERLRRRDPMPLDASVDPVNSDRARALEQRIMQSSTDQAEPNRPTARPTWLVGAGVAAALAVVVGVIAANTGSDAPTKEPTVAVAAQPLRLSLSASDPLTSICTPFDKSQLTTAEVAFGGAVTEVANGSVTVDIDRWYQGGSATTAELVVPEGFSAALDGVDFVAGTRYLITASDGVIGSCGSSGEATPEFVAIFDAAFNG